MIGSAKDATSSTRSASSGGSDPPSDLVVGCWISHGPRADDPSFEIAAAPDFVA